MLSDRKHVITSRPSPLMVAEAFIAAYARGDADAILAMCADHASADYVPWGDARAKSHGCGRGGYGGGIPKRSRICRADYVPP